MNGIVLIIVSFVVGFFSYTIHNNRLFDR